MSSSSSATRDIPARIKSFKKCTSRQENGIRYAVTEMKGWRSEMEDAHSAECGRIEGWSFFGIFDGHGGDFSSRCAAGYLWERIYTELKRKAGKEKKFDELSEEQVIESVKQGFLVLDKDMREKCVSQPSDHDSNSYFYPTYIDKSGTTVVACLITKKHIYLINCGDSRGILVRRPGKLELVTYDHKPSQLKEKQRIQNAGGVIALNRVNGGLATSRGLGDFEYKSVNNLEPYQQFVSPEPDFYVVERDLQNDYFVVLACDGVWDVKKNENVMRHVLDQIEEATGLEKFEEITKSLADSCFDDGSKDNISLILIQFTPNSSTSNESKPSSIEMPSSSKSHRNSYHGESHPQSQQSQQTSQSVYVKRNAPSNNK